LPRAHNFLRSEAAYHYGASTEEGRKYPGAYLIQWEAIKEAKKKEHKRYNFWGVPPGKTKNSTVFINYLFLTRFWRQ